MAIIRRAEFPADSVAVFGIRRAFIANTPVDLDHRDNEVAFATFTEKYAAPKDCVLLAEAGEAIKECVGILTRPT